MSTKDQFRLATADKTATPESQLPETGLLTVPEAAKFLRIGRSAAYELARRFEATVTPRGSPASGSGNDSCEYRLTPYGRW